LVKVSLFLFRDAESIVIIEITCKIYSPANIVR